MTFWHHVSDAVWCSRVVWQRCLTAWAGPGRPSRMIQDAADCASSRIKRDEANVICPLTCCAAQQNNGRNEQVRNRDCLWLHSDPEAKRKSASFSLTVSGRSGCCGDSNDDESRARPWMLRTASVGWAMGLTCNEVSLLSNSLASRWWGN